MMSHNVFLTLLFVAAASHHAFEWSTSSSRPFVDRRAIAGVWKLTPIPEPPRPLKEFTVYPKKPLKKCFTGPDVLLVLKEDGSFQQAEADDQDREGKDHSDSTDINNSWNKFQERQREKEKTRKQQFLDFLKGTWDYRDGNLILAADRPPPPGKKYGYKAEYDAPNPTDESRGAKKPLQDTLLEGRVVANFQTRLEKHPVLDTTTRSKETTQQQQQQQQPSADGSVDKDGTDSGSTKNAATSAATRTAVDAHLSVPRGYIKSGRFFYPKKHPSFFEQPMFQPKQKGVFTLQQVLGNLNAAPEQAEEEVIEKFQRSDFYNKTFLLTSHPIGPRTKKKKKEPWQLRRSHQDDETDEEEDRPTNIRVMQVAFHANNTFSTTAGLGEDAILRGKFDVIGHEKDQLWMQVIRFGFGRSVSGSVYSEGRMLTHEDAKTYWGTIFGIVEGTADKGGEKKGQFDELSSGTEQTQVSGNRDEKRTQRLEVKGSVLFGAGLEPLPVARFIMRETDPSVNEVDMLEEEEEEDEGSIGTGASERLKDEGIDWSVDNEDTFQ